MHRSWAVYFLFISSHIHKLFSTFKTLVGHNRSIHQLFSPLLCESGALIPLANRDMRAAASRVIFNGPCVLCQETFLPNRVRAKTLYGLSGIILLVTKEKASCTDPPVKSYRPSNSACRALAKRRELAMPTSFKGPSPSYFYCSHVPDKKQNRCRLLREYRQSSNAWSRSSNLCQSRQSHSHTSPSTEWRSEAAQHCLKVPENVLVCHSYRAHNLISM